MSGWALFWTWSLWIGLAFFTLVVLVVTVGGVRDIRHMLRSINRQHREGTDAEDTPPKS